MSDFLLHPHVYLGFTDGGAVFLDVKRDRYFGIDSAELETLRAIVFGSARNVEAEKFGQQLLEQGLMTREPSGRCFVPATIKPPRGRVAERSFLDRPKLSASHFWNISRSYLQTKYAQKMRSFEKTLAGVSVRKIGRASCRERVCSTV